MSYRSERRARRERMEATKAELIRVGNLIQAMAAADLAAGQLVKEATKNARLNRESFRERGHQVERRDGIELTVLLPDLLEQLTDAGGIEGECVRFVIEIHVATVSATPSK